MSAIRFVSHRILRITRDFLVILACFKAGTAISAILPFRFPDSIIGMLLLFLLLNLQIVKLQWVEMVRVCC